MGEAKHTAGPWRVMKDDVFSDRHSHSGLVAAVYSGGRPFSGGEAELAANLALISAAPDLFEALSVAINTVECASLGRDKQELPWYRMARAAIAKASPAP